MAFYSNLVVNQIYTVRWLVDIGLPRGVNDNQFWIVDEFPRWDISVFLLLDWLAEYEWGEYVVAGDEVYMWW